MKTYVEWQIRELGDGSWTKKILEEMQRMIDEAVADLHGWHPLGDDDADILEFFVILFANRY